MISFGPIPSRRLGKSLGINNIPSAKVCSYSCIYCQVGTTMKYETACREFYNPETIFTEVSKHLMTLQKNDKPDYLTFVSNGEPTLDINLGKSIEKLKEIGIPMAVITNGSMLSVQQVRDNLNLADWVSLKVDTYDENIWKTINRPISNLGFYKLMNGYFRFASDFRGKLVTETMLVEGVNDSPVNIHKTAKLIKELNPHTAYISIPTRPPALETAKVPDETTITQAFQIFNEQNIHTELLLGFEGINTGFTGNAIEDIVNICTVHPLREDTMMELLRKDKADYQILDTLIEKKLLRKIRYKSQEFYIRQFHN